MKSVPQMGCHLILDFHNTKVDVNNFEELDKNFRRIILDSGATIETCSYKLFEPQGISILYLLSESHFSIHTWPEHGACAIDFYHCGETARLRMMKAEELLCDFFGWDNCTGSMIIDRGTYHYTLIAQDEHSSILFKKNKLVERQASEIGDSRIYHNETLGKLLAVDGLIQNGFHNIKDIGDLFTCTEDCLILTADQSPKSQGENNSSSSKNQNAILVIGGGDLSLTQEILSQGFSDKVVVLDSCPLSQQKIKLLMDNSKNLNRLVTEGKVELIQNLTALDCRKFSGIIVIDKSQKLSNLKEYLNFDSYYAEVVSSEKEFRDVCNKEGLNKVTFHNISNMITRFLIGKGRYS
jgi:S-adenosylmethionine decarboxylase proenzyme